MKFVNFSILRLLLVLICAAIPTLICYINIPKPKIQKVKIPFYPVPKQVWALYLGIYGNNVTDGRWVTWRRKCYDWKRNYYDPPSSIPSFLYPQLGLYSSHDKNTIRAHFQMLSNAGVDAILYQWWSFNSTEGYEEENNGFSDKTVPLLLEVGEEFGIKVAIEIQPYRNRNITLINEDIKGILEKYAKHKTYLRLNGRPVIVIYEPASIPALKLNYSDFQETPYIIGTITESEHLGYNVEQNFDGMFTFGANDFQVWSTNRTNWPKLRQDINSRGSIFVAAVAPGHNNAKIESWNKVERKRKGMKYYDDMWKSAIDAKSDIIVINSFNGWLDSTEIEPAYPRPGYEFNEDVWSGKDGKPTDYLIAAKKWIGIYKADKSAY